MKKRYLFPTIVCRRAVTAMLCASPYPSTTELKVVEGEKGTATVNFNVDKGHIRYGNAWTEGRGKTNVWGYEENE